MFNVRSISSFSQNKCSLFRKTTSEISAIVASLNQGNCLKGRKYSFSLINNQKPCSEIFVTSTSKMLSPTASDFISVFFNYILQQFKLFLVESNTFYQFNFRFNPKFRFPVWTYHMNVYSFFFTGEKEKPVILFFKNCRTHMRTNLINSHQL